MIVVGAASLILVSCVGVVCAGCWFGVGGCVLPVFSVWFPRGGWVLVLGVGIGRVVFGGFLGEFCWRGAFPGVGAFGVVIVFLCAGRARGRVVLVRGSVARARGFLVWCVLDCSFLGCPVLGVTFRRVGLCLFGRVIIVGGTDGTGCERAREPCAKTPLVR